MLSLTSLFAYEGLHHDRSLDHIGVLIKIFENKCGFGCLREVTKPPDSSVRIRALSSRLLFGFETNKKIKTNKNK